MWCKKGVTICQCITAEELLLLVILSTHMFLEKLPEQKYKEMLMGGPLKYLASSGNSNM